MAMIEIGLVCILGIIFAFGYKIMGKVDEFFEKGGFSEEK